VTRPDRAWLTRLVAEGSLEPCPRDVEWVRRALRDAELDLAWARRKLAGGDFAHPAGAAADAWEAALKAVQGFLNLVRLRLTDQRAHHVAALNAASALLGPEWQPRIRRLRELRRARRSGVYDVGPPPDAALLARYTDDVELLLNELEAAVGRAGAALGESED